MIPPALEIPLRLEPEPTSNAPATAWLLSGGDSSRWLAEIGRWQVDDAQVRLYLLPTSAQDLRTSGVLAVVSGARPHETPMGLPFAECAPGCFRPAASATLPRLSPAEWQSWRGDGVLILHPGLGPIAYAAGDALRIVDLLAPPHLADEDWERARPAEGPHPKLTSIALRIPPGSENPFGEESEEIGSEPVRPPQKQDERKSLEGMFQSGSSSLLSKLSKYFASIPHTGAARNGINKMEDWVNRKLQGVTDEMRRKREEALHKLLTELKEEPEGGLRHAIPLGGSGLNRGVAPPSWDLGSHHIDFSHGQLGGGRATDSWDVSAEIRARLRAEYIRLAERERQLGRYRRSAYIHAKLLGDLAMAASILREGGHAHDAARLYLDHLRNPLLAAECYVEARLLPEAIAIYEKERAWERLARVYQLAGDEEKARRTWRTRADQLITTGDLLKAAEVMREQLQEEEAALALLESAWPGKPQALLCARRYLEWRGQKSDHAAAAKFIRRAYGDEGRGVHVNAWLDLLSTVQAAYPDRAVQELAEDAGRIVVARALVMPREEEDVKRLAGALARLAPSGDQLLRRDSLRYVDRVKVAAKKARTAPKAPSKELPVETLREFSMPSGFQWAAAAACDGRFFVAGIHVTGSLYQDSLVAARATFEGGMHVLLSSPVRRLAPGAGHDPIIAATVRADYDEAFIFHREDLTAMSPSRITGFDGMPKKAEVVRPPVEQHHILGGTYTPDGHLLICRYGNTPDDVRLTTYMPGLWMVVADTPIDLAETLTLDRATGTLPLCALEEHKAVAVGNQLFHFHRGETLHRGVIEFEEPITSIIPGPRWTKPHVAVVMNTCVAVCWFEGASAQAYVVETHLEEPRAAFSNDGVLIVFSGRQGSLYDCDSKGPKFATHFQHDGSAPVAIIPGSEARTFALLESNGRVKVHRYARAILRA